MANGRKYLLNLSDKFSYGLGSKTIVDQTYNLLNSFTNENIVFSQITLDELSTLSNIDYEDRLINFLDSINIESEVEKLVLYSGATNIESDCSDYFCDLNSNFIVYRFLDGIRIVNVGNANGKLQYKVFPINDDEVNYSWQETPTFLNLDVNGIYFVKIRDYMAGYDEVICEFEKVISIPLLIPSTTTTRGNRILALNQISTGSIDSSCYKTGCFSISPILSSGEKMKVCYDATVNQIGSGLSEVALKCRPNGSVDFNDYVYISNINGVSPTGTFTLNCGDSMCYSITATATIGGSSSLSKIKITSVDGLGTNNSSINNLFCESSVDFEKPSLPILIALSGDTTNPINSINGKITFNPPIPENETINMVISATTSNIGNVGVSIGVKNIIDDNYSTIETYIGNVLNTSHCFNITANYDEYYCYNINGSNSCGNVTYGCLKILSASSPTVHIIPQINIPNTESLILQANKIPVCAGFMNQGNQHYNNGNNLTCYVCSLGVISTTLSSHIMSISLADTIYKSVCICYSAQTCSSIPSVTSVASKVEFFCRSNNGDPYSRIAYHSNLSSVEVPTTINSSCSVDINHQNSFTMDCTDTIYYNLYAGKNSTSKICIISITDGYPYGNGIVDGCIMINKKLDYINVT